VVYRAMQMKDGSFISSEEWLRWVAAAFVFRTCAGSYDAQGVERTEERSQSGNTLTCANRGRRHTASRYRCVL